MYEGAVQDLIDELGRLPGVGPKGAQQIAFHLLQADPADVVRLADALAAVKDKVMAALQRCIELAASGGAEVSVGFEDVSYVTGQQLTQATTAAAQGHVSGTRSRRRRPLRVRRAGTCRSR